jgi:hypothetical protein
MANRSQIRAFSLGVKCIYQNRFWLPIIEM